MRAQTVGLQDSLGKCDAEGYGTERVSKSEGMGMETEIDHALARRRASSF